MRNKKHFRNERRKRKLFKEQERLAARRHRGFRIKQAGVVMINKPVVRERMKVEIVKKENQKVARWSKFKTTMGRMFGGRGK